MACSQFHMFTDVVYVCLCLKGALDAHGQFGVAQLSVNFKMIQYGVRPRLPEP